jgi:hypothetical protein
MPPNYVTRRGTLANYLVLDRRDGFFGSLILVAVSELLQVPPYDPTLCLDSACCRRYGLQQLVWSLKTMCRIFLKEFLKRAFGQAVEHL